MASAWRKALDKARKAPPAAPAKATTAAPTTTKKAPARKK